MKKIFTFALSLSIITLIAFSCSNDEAISNNQEAQANKEMAEVLQTKYGIETTILDNGSFEFKYLDGRILNVSQNDGKIVFTGSRVNNEKLTFESVTKDVALENLNSKSNLFLKGIPKQEFIKSVNNYSNLNQLAKVASPCDEHSSNEEFDDCVEREVDEFCDGLVGCLALATNPVIIIGVIAIHCAAC